jgi:hypothetical protein
MISPAIKIPKQLTTFTKRRGFDDHGLKVENTNALKHLG